MPGVLDEVQQPAARLPLARQIALAKTALRLVFTSARGDFLLIAGCAALAGAANAGQVILTGHAAGKLAAGSIGPAVLTSVLVLVGLIAVTKLLAVVQSERERLAGERVARNAQVQVLEVAGGVELDCFDRPDFYDRLQRAMVTAEVRPVQLASGVLGTLSAFTAAAGIAAGLVAISPLIAALVAVSAVPTWLAASRANAVLYRFSYRITQTDRERIYLSQIMTDKEFAGEIRAFGLSDFLRQRFVALSDRRIAEVTTVMHQRLRANIIGTVASGAVIAAVVVVAVVLARNGRLTVADAAAATVAIGLMTVRLTALSEQIARLHECALFLEDFTGFIEPRRRRLSAAPAPAALNEPVEVEVRDVYFRYANSDRDALQGVSLSVKPGEVVALVGENGSGKSTLAKLIAGLYRPRLGAVTWNSAEPSAGGAAFAFQDFARYDFTAGENIALGRPSSLSDGEAVRRAAGLAKAAPFVDELPQGYDTRLGSHFTGGVDLSGGQWQRLALARMFFRDCPLVILDEPSAALDPKAERELFDDIGQLYADRTVILISHRFANVRAADRIYVMAAGRVTESGTHDELMALRGHYAELFNLQAAAYQPAAYQPQPREPQQCPDGTSCATVSVAT